jgi:hypothetical protein
MKEASRDVKDVLIEDVRSMYATFGIVSATYCINHVLDRENVRTILGCWLLREAVDCPLMNYS